MNSANQSTAQPTPPPGTGSPQLAAHDPRQAMASFYSSAQAPPFAQFPQMPPYVGAAQVAPWTQAQYAAWMHQAYAQYMAQYMHL